MSRFKITGDELRHAAWWVIPALIVGILLSLLIPRPEIGVIQLSDAIDSTTSESLITQITYARQDPNIHAVVLIINSPGGTVVDSEAIYIELARLRKTKPVVTWVSGLDASGAYYLSSGTDYIVAVPSSEVGNVGVIAYLPSSPMILQDLLSTGPYKLWGSPRDTTMREVEMIKQGFFQAVTLGRGSRLKIGPDILLRGQIWPASTAYQYGLVDQLGSETEAYDEAASLAHLWHYKMTDLYEASGLSQNTSAAGFFQQTNDGSKSAYPSQAGIYMLYIPALPGPEK
jgi:protease IV